MAAIPSYPSKSTYEWLETCRAKKTSRSSLHQRPSPDICYQEVGPLKRGGDKSTYATHRGPDVLVQNLHTCDVYVARITESARRNFPETQSVLYLATCRLGCIVLGSDLPSVPRARRIIYLEASKNTRLATSGA